MSNIFGYVVDFTITGRVQLAVESKDEIKSTLESLIDFCPTDIEINSVEEIKIPGKEEGSK